MIWNDNVLSVLSQNVKISISEKGQVQDEGSRRKMKTFRPIFPAGFGDSLATENLTVDITVIFGESFCSPSV